MSLTIFMNKISFIDQDVFNFLPALRSLSISDNQITEILFGYGELIPLEKLYIDNNPVTKYPDLSKVIHKLERLDYGGPKAAGFFDNITAHRFYNLPQHFNLSNITYQYMTELSLTYIQFNSPPNDIISVLPNLEKLTLENAKLTKLPDFIKTPEIEILELANNEIEKVAKSDLELLKNLREVSLKDNKVSQVRFHISSNQSLNILPIM